MFIVLYPLALHLIVVGIGALLGGPALVFFTSAGVPNANPLLTFIGLVLLHAFLRGIGEETGWRGYALPGLKARWSPLSGSLALGLLWSLWRFHPANWGVLLPSAAPFVLNVVGTTVVYTWLFNNTAGSLLIAVLFHMTLNVAERVVPIGLFGGDTARLAIQVVVVWPVVAAVVVTAGPELGLEKGRSSG